MGNPAYEPDIDISVWQEIRRFVREVVTATDQGTPYTEGQRNIAASRLIAWTWQTAGLPLQREMAFNRDVIARFIAVGCPSLKPASRGNLRSQLLRMSEVLLGPRSVQRRLSPLPPSEPTAPYSGQEIIGLRSWAEAQSTPSRRANAWVLLAACAGAGLSASELGNLRLSDVHVDSAGVNIRLVNERPRTVPVLREWEPPLRQRTQELAPDRFAFRENHGAYYPNLITNFVNRSNVIGVRPQTQRLRSTWILRHLEAGTPVVLLMRAAGVESLEALTRYVRFVQDVDEDEARVMLRDAR